MPKRSKMRSRRGTSNTALKGEAVEFEIHDMAHGGYGLGHYRGAPVFVPYTLPGEAISAQITGARGRALFGRGLRLQAASSDRVEPRCPHFGPGRCWGCHWQHIDYAAQLLLKQDVLADQLSRIGALPDSVIEEAVRPLAPAPASWGYDHRLQLLRAKSGDWGLRRQDRGIEAIGECYLAHPDLIDLLHDLDLEYERAARMTLWRGSDGRLMAVFEIDGEEAPALATDRPLSVNLILPDRQPINLVGDAHKIFEIAGRTFRVTAGAYMRGNIGALAGLVASVVEAARMQGGERLLDLYAGVGVFSAFLADAADLITLVESYPPAANDADVNLSEFDNIDVVEGAVETVLADMVEDDARYDVALVDPPAAGLSEEVVRLLSLVTARRIVYVSSDPASLARDSRRLMDAGFQLREIQPLDLAPQTYYISAVARFER
ncbi:MAG: hypothetical protein OXG85_02150 [Chloroflexi bacterium]|nr:hypothetical protein [Chloroflexota bacterium]